MIAPPRFWEAMCSEYQVEDRDAGRLKGAAARVALDIGMRVAERGCAGSASVLACAGGGLAHV